MGATPKGQSSARPKQLTDKQKRFIEEYCIDFNGTKAAQRAGFSAKTAREQASQMLHKPHVKDAVEKRMAIYSMTAAEGIKRLTDWGRGSVKQFLKVDEQGHMSINLAHPEAKEHLHLIKKVKQTRSTMLIGEVERVEVRTEVELYDAKDAVHKILQIHGRYAPQKFDHTTLGQPLPGSNIYLPDNGRD